LFDIRDIEIDRKENIRTLAVFLGKKRSYLIVYLLLFVFVILSLLQFFYYDDKPVLIAMLVSASATFFTVGLTKKTNSDFVYLAGVDGMMLLQAMLVYLLGLKF
jgi:4-hydroxybenzoate polyprenyltransferase